MKLSINGDITDWNGEIYQLRNAIKNNEDNEPIELDINSYGGDAFLGISIMNALRAYEGEVTVNVTGIAASAASIIAMGADKVRIYNNAQLMIHNPWTIAYGNAADLRKAAEDLDKVQESVVASYTHRIALDTAKELLDGETYLTANEAIEYGLADEIIESEAKEVESELFAAKAKEFNSTITPGSKEPQGGHVPAAATAGAFHLSDDDIEKIKQSIVDELKKESKTDEGQQAKADDDKPKEKKVLSIFK